MKFCYPIILSLMVLMQTPSSIWSLYTDNAVVMESEPGLSNSQPSSCELITIPLCEGIQYNTTIMPNLLGHAKQEAAGLELHQYMPLVKIQCSPDLQIFLCSIFVPVCNILEKPIPPCRSLCLSARKGCEGLMNKFGFTWPENLDCNHFPVSSRGNICVGDNTAEQGSPHTSSNADGPGGHGSISHYSGSNDYPHYPQSPVGVNNSNIPFKCPSQFKVPSGMGYSFRIQGKEHKECGMPCDDLLLEANERHLIRIWTGTWAIFCVISSAFTIITYQIEPDRFRFPEKSIIFLSWCYLAIGLVFIYGFFFGESVACNEPFPSDVSNLQMARTITQGNRKEKCTLSFMVLFFFTISNAIWWVVLTATWFMIAALKWANDPVEANSHCFHLLSWATSAILTIIVLALDRIEGDFLTGVCFIGIWNPTYLVAFVLIPLTLLLLIGFFFLISGFISLLRTRSFLKANYPTEGMDKQMFKIGLYSVLYFFPTLMLIGCFYYEQEHIDSFLMHWLGKACQKPDYGLACPMRMGNKQLAIYASKKPHFALYFVKYFVWLMPGIGSGFWIWSEKTVSSWTRVFRRMLCMDTRIDYV